MKKQSFLFILICISTNGLSSPNKKHTNKNEEKAPHAFTLVNHTENSWLSLTCEFTDNTHSTIECNSLEIQLNQPKFLKTLMAELPSLALLKEEMKKNPGKEKKNLSDACIGFKNIPSDIGPKTRALYDEYRTVCSSNKDTTKQILELFEIIAKHKAATCSIAAFHHTKATFDRKSANMWVHSVQDGFCDSTRIESISRDPGSNWKYTDMLIAVGNSDHRCDEERKKINKPSIASNDAVETMELNCSFLSAHSYP